MGQLENLQNRRNALGEHIVKGFAADNDFDELTKARAVGDVHKNGKWVWTEYAPGKFDWRGLKTANAAQPKKETAVPGVETEDFSKLSYPEFIDLARKTKDRMFKLRGRDDKKSQKELSELSVLWGMIVAEDERYNRKRSEHVEQKRVELEAERAADRKAERDQLSKLAEQMSAEHKRKFPPISNTEPYRPGEKESEQAIAKVRSRINETIREDHKAADAARKVGTVSADGQRVWTEYAPGEFKWQKRSKSEPKKTPPSAPIDDDEEDLSDLKRGDKIMWGGKERTVLVVNKEKMSAVLDDGTRINWDVIKKAWVDAFEK